MLKSSFVSVPINWPDGSLTVARMRTRLTLTRKVSDCAAPAGASHNARLAAISNGRMLVPLSFHPDFAILEMLFLPDRNNTLEAIDPLQCGIECSFAMRRAHDDGNAGLTDEQPAQAVDHRDTIDCKAAGDIAP